MKMMLATLVSVFSMSAMACPTFNGTYECAGEGMEQTMTVKTEVINGVHQYSLDDARVLADGQYRPVDFMGSTYDMSASCLANGSLKLDIKFDGGVGDNPDCGPEAWNLIFTMNFKPNGNNILESHEGATVCSSGKRVPADDMKGSMTCVKR